MDTITINAKGQLIEILKDNINKSEVLKTYYGRWNYNDNPYYLDYDSETIIELCNYMTNQKISNFESLSCLVDELIIDVKQPVNIDYNTLTQKNDSNENTNIFGTIYNSLTNTFNAKQIDIKENQIFLSNIEIKEKYDKYSFKYDEFKNYVQDKYDVIFDKYSLATFLTMISYYEGYHPIKIIDLNIKLYHGKNSEQIDYIAKYGNPVIMLGHDALLDITANLKEQFETDGILFNVDTKYFVMTRINKTMKFYQIVYLTLKPLNTNDLLHERILFRRYPKDKKDMSTQFKKNVIKYIRDYKKAYVNEIFMVSNDDVSNSNDVIRGELSIYTAYGNIGPAVHNEKQNYKYDHFMENKVYLK